MNDAASPSSSLSRLASAGFSRYRGFLCGFSASRKGPLHDNSLSPVALGNQLCPAFLESIEIPACCKKNFVGVTLFFAPAFDKEGRRTLREEMAAYLHNYGVSKPLELLISGRQTKAYATVLTMRFPLQEVHRIPAIMEELHGAFASNIKKPLLPRYHFVTKKVPVVADPLSDKDEKIMRSVPCREERPLEPLFPSHGAVHASSCRP